MSNSKTQKLRKKNNYKRKNKFGKGKEDEYVG
jgi:hypothetical protein